MLNYNNAIMQVQISMLGYSLINSNSNFLAYKYFTLFAIVIQSFAILSEPDMQKMTDYIYQLLHFLAIAILSREGKNSHTKT